MARRTELKLKIQGLEMNKPLTLRITRSKNQCRVETDTGLVFVEKVEKSEGTQALPDSRPR